VKNILARIPSRGMSKFFAPSENARGCAALCIVVPVLDEAATLGACLRALQPLRARGAWVVVVDGGSVDATPDIARGHADRVLQAPRGRAAQMNAGAAACVAECYLFLHADTTLPDGADQRVLNAVRAGASWGRFDVRINSPLRSLRLVETLINLRSRLSGIATGDLAMFVRSDVFAACGGFADIALMEDIELSTRLKALARPLCLKERVLTSGRRWEQHGVWRTITLMWRLRGAYFLGADPNQLAQRYGYQPRSS
jgi:rSAM/selenodomain-associated transferase 2